LTKLPLKGHGPVCGRSQLRCRPLFDQPCTSRLHWRASFIVLVWSAVQNSL
jgi:hypothetical protein